MIAMSTTRRVNLLLPRPAALPVLAAAVLALAGPSPAQTPAAPPVPAPDLLPLRKALSPLSGSGLIESRSTILMTGSRGGVSFTLREDAHILARRGGKFRAELTQTGPAGPPRTKLLAVSDGRTVWLYRPGLRAYSVMTNRAWAAADDDVSALGLAVGGFFLSDGHEMILGFRGITRDNTRDVLAVLADAGITLTGRAESSGGVDYFVYRMVLSREKMAYRFSVDTQTGALKRIELTGTQGGTRFALAETLSLLRVPASAPAGAFTWTPPPGTKRSVRAGVDPF